MKPNVVDWIALGLVVVSALAGMRRGLVVTTLSFGGLVAGAYAGSRVAPHLLRGGAATAGRRFARDRERRGGGVDGARTRDLRRDRPAF